jgi:hypothetical protein
MKWTKFGEFARSWEVQEIGTTKLVLELVVGIGEKGLD